jgi:hypothetical protein
MIRSKLITSSLERKADRRRGRIFVRRIEVATEVEEARRRSGQQFATQTRRSAVPSLAKTCPPVALRSSIRAVDARGRTARLHRQPEWLAAPSTAARKDVDQRKEGDDDHYSDGDDGNGGRRDNHAHLSSLRAAGESVGATGQRGRRLRSLTSAASRLSPLSNRRLPAILAEQVAQAGAERLEFHAEPVNRNAGFIQLAVVGSPPASRSNIVRKSFSSEAMCRSLLGGLDY